jgi:PKD repeat protein
MEQSSSSVRRCRIAVSALALALAAASLFAPNAGAELVRINAHQVAGVTPVVGINPASIPGSFATQRNPAAVSPESALATYHGGPVLHGSRPFLIFWDPNGQIPAATKAVLERYFTDVAAASGTSSNTLGVDRQYTDATGFAAYRQVFTSSQAITDTQQYPPASAQCTESSGGFTETACLFDRQIRAEIVRVVAADGLPTGITGDAPIYFVVTPPTVNSCMEGNQTCADSDFCGYHSSFTDDGNTVLYADIPTLLAADAPKECQHDGNSQVQDPNGDQIGDVVIKYMSHEDNEAITDPLEDAWYNDASGNEIADTCNASGPLSLTKDTDPNAFNPTLGGSAASGSLFDQVINDDEYYTQSVWSNGALDCEMRPTGPATISAGFSLPASIAAGKAATFDPSASTSTSPGGFSSTTWNFGDGASDFSRGAPSALTHSYAAAGTYTATLTLVDALGDVASASHTITVRGAPSAAFTVGTSHARAATPVPFDGTSSSELGGTAITGWLWSFGDSSTANGAAAAHIYTRAGIYDVTLTVTDAFGTTATVTHPLTVWGSPTAVIRVRTAHPAARAPVSLTARRSRDVGSVLVREVWRFGDGRTATAMSVRHRYRRPGRYRLTLTVTDRSGATSIARKILIVKTSSRRRGSTTHRVR